MRAQGALLQHHGARGGLHELNVRPVQQMAGVHAGLARARPHRSVTAAAASTSAGLAAGPGPGSIATAAAAAAAAGAAAGVSPCARRGPVFGSSGSHRRRRAPAAATTTTASSPPASAASSSFSSPQLQPQPTMQTLQPQQQPPGSALSSSVSGDAPAWFFTERGQRAWAEALELSSLTPDLPQLLAELGVRYDPDRLAARLESRRAQVYGRAVRISAALGGFTARIGRDYALGQVEQNMERRAGELRRLLSALGPSFVKVGQALSARPDLLPQPYLDALSELQDRLPSFPNEIAWAVMEEELGCAVGDVYSELSAAPVAAASLGQVYKGVLRATGETVAVKVQRPGIGENIAVDMLLLRRLMAVVDDNLPQVSQPLVPLVDEFAARLFAELDYVAEGHNAERFQALYGHMPRVRTPAIHWEATRRRVITMEWIEGVKLTNKAAMDAAGLSIVDFVDVGVECTLRQLLEHGYFHADPHPGNLLASRDGSLVYLDFGMMSTAPEYARYAIMAHVVHLVNRDYDAMCRDYYALQFMDPEVDTSPIAPALQAFFDDVLDASVSELNFKAIVDGLGAVLFQFPFRVPAYYALILRSLTVLEGLALQADPSYKLLGRAYPYVARRLLTDPAPELRASFEELVIKDGALRWNRLENLLREGSKSSDFDSAQLWMLATWLLGPGAGEVRARLSAELARMLDAAAAADARARIAGALGGNDALARQLVPVQANEEEARRRAALVLETLMSRLSATAPGGGGAPSFEGFKLPQGSGPFGLMTPGDAAGLVTSLQASLAGAAPQLRQLLQEPGAAELVRDVAGQLAQRFAARVVKFVFSGAPSAAAAAAAPSP